MFIDFLLDTWAEQQAKQAIVWRGQTFTYGWLLDRYRYWKKTLHDNDLKPGSVVILEADFSPNAVALFFALVDRGCILVPLTESVSGKKAEFTATAQGEVCFAVDGQDAVSITPLSNAATHPFYLELRRSGHPGLVLFSSGSTGESKAAVHDLTGLLEKFKVPRHAFRTLTFLLYDHIGGVNTMLYTLANAGCMITVQKRDPDSVLETIEKHRVELLPTSPTFLNLVLLSDADKRYDLSSLKTITYGTEPMPANTLKRLHELFPGIRLQQTYGLSELGILRGKSKAPDSLWLKVGGEGFETRIVDSILQIKARSAMLGYLNAPSPFTDDGWFNTNDVVETDGEYLTILGRRSEIINVGGEKVYPAEIENVIQGIDGISEVTVYGEKNPLTGNIVCADITPAAILDDAGKKEIVKLVKKHCRQELQSYKVPLRVNIIDEAQHTERFKKARR